MFDDITRGLPSPGDGDALALTFAFPVAIEMPDLAATVPQRDYDPFTPANIRLGHDPLTMRW